MDRVRPYPGLVHGRIAADPPPDRVPDPLAGQPAARRRCQARRGAKVRNRTAARPLCRPAIPSVGIEDFGGVPPTGGGWWEYHWFSAQLTMELPP